MEDLHDDKGYSEEKCIRCSWVMGDPPINCNNDNTPHVFPSSQQVMPLDKVAQIVSLGWCHVNTSSKEMDVDLAMAIAEEVQKVTYPAVFDTKPSLGLATTHQLLEELEVRMRVTQNSNKGRELGVLCQEALDNLDQGVLNYSTVQPEGSLT